MNNTLIDIILCFVENAIILQIINSICFYKSNRLEICFWLFFSLFSSSVNSMAQPLFNILGCLALLIYVWFNYKGNKLQNILIALFVFVINLLLSILIISFLSLISADVGERLMTDTFFYICAVIIAKFTLISVFMIIRYIVKRFTIQELNDFNYKIIFAEFILFLLSISYVYYFFTINVLGFYTTIFLLFLFIIFATSNIIILYKNYSLKLLNYQKDMKLQTNMKYLEVTQEGMNNMDLYLKEIHEINNMKMLAIHYLEEENIDKALNVLGAIRINDIGINNENVVLNKIINFKHYTMVENDIKFYSYIEDTLKFINDIDLSVLFGNLLDNAIEAQKKIDCKNRYIRMMIKRVPIGVMIIIENPYEQILYDGNSMRTTKPNHKFHGYGISNIKEVISNYNGLIKFETKDKIFKCKIIFDEV